MNSPQFPPIYLQNAPKTPPKFARSCQKKRKITNNHVFFPYNAVDIKFYKLCGFVFVMFRRLDKRFGNFDRKLKLSASKSSKGIISEVILLTEEFLQKKNNTIFGDQACPDLWH